MSASPAERKAGPVSIVRIEAAINAWREVYPPAPDGEDGYALDAGSNCLAELYGTMICYQLPDVPLDSSERGERALLAGPPLPFLAPVWRDAHWRLWEVQDATPLVRGPATLRSLGVSRIVLDVQGPGTATVLVSR